MTIDRKKAAQLAMKHLQLAGAPHILAPRSTKTPTPEHRGPVLELSPRRHGGGWIVEVWQQAASYLATPRPLADHRLWVQAGGDIEAEDVDPGNRRRGRRPIYAPDEPRPRRVQVDLGEDLAAVETLAEKNRMSASSVVAAIVAHHLRGVPLPW